MIICEGPFCIGFKNYSLLKVQDLHVHSPSGVVQSLCAQISEASRTGFQSCTGSHVTLGKCPGMIGPQFPLLKGGKQSKCFPGSMVVLRETIPGYPSAWRTVSAPQKGIAGATSNDHGHKESRSADAKQHVLAGSSDSGFEHACLAFSTFLSSQYPLLRMEQYIEKFLF